MLGYTDLQIIVGLLAGIMWAVLMGWVRNKRQLTGGHKVRSFAGRSC